MGEPTDREPADDEIEKVRFLSEWFRNMAALEFDDPNNDIAQVIEASFTFDERATPRQLDAIADLGITPGEAMRACRDCPDVGQHSLGSSVRCVRDAMARGARHPRHLTPHEAYSLIRACRERLWDDLEDRRSWIAHNDGSPIHAALDLPTLSLQLTGDLAQARDVLHELEAALALHRLIDDPDPATADLAALQAEALARVRFCRQALAGLCADRTGILDGPSDP